MPQKTYSERGSVLKKETELGDADNVLPDSVKAALKIRYEPVPIVGSDVDSAILADAKTHIERLGPAMRFSPKRRLSTLQWTAMAAAAACLLFFVLRSNQPSNLENDSIAKSNVTSLLDQLSGDVDLSGRVDILDAFAMARQLRDGRGEFRDINRDGRFDQFDIDLVTDEAVKL